MDTFSAAELTRDLFPLFDKMPLTMSLISARMGIHTVIYLNRHGEEVEGRRDHSCQPPISQSGARVECYCTVPYPLYFCTIEISNCPCRDLGLDFHFPPAGLSHAGKSKGASSESTEEIPGSQQKPQRFPASSLKK